MKMLKTKKNELGMVSLIVCLILMLLVTLITLSFALLTRRSQRQALDRQLSSQAFYAAETGINTAINAYQNNPAMANVTSCDSAAQSVYNTSSTLDATSNVAYTCVLLDKNPPQIDDVVQTTGASVYKVASTGLDHVDIYWESTTGTTATWPGFSTTNGNFPPASQWPADAPGVIRVQLIPFEAGVSTRTSIANGVVDVTGVPSNVNGVNLHAVGATNGEILTGMCNAAHPGAPMACSIHVTNLGGKQYYIRVRSVYNPSHIAVVAKDASNNTLDFTDAQLMIDATGRAGDVVKRIKVYRPLTSNNILPDYAVEIADDLCKRLLVTPALTSTDMDTTPATGTPLCDPSGL